MKTAATTNWNSLLESKCTAKTMKSFATGEASTRSVTEKLANSSHAGEFRKLVRENGWKSKGRNMDLIKAVLAEVK